MSNTSKPDFVHEALLAGIDAADADLPQVARIQHRLDAADRHEFRRAVAAQARDRHAVHVAARRQHVGVEIRMGVEPEHAQLASRVAAMPGGGTDRADRETVIATEQHRHAPAERVRRAPPRARAGSRQSLRAGADSRPRAAATDSAGPLRLPRSTTSRPCASSTDCSCATRSASGPIDAPRAPAPTSVGAPIKAICMSGRATRRARTSRDRPAQPSVPPNRSFGSATPARGRSGVVRPAAPTRCECRKRSAE